MLIASQKKVYTLSLESGAINLRYEGQIACIAESSQADLIALEDGRIVVISPGREGKPDDGNVPYEIVTGIEGRITSILQLPATGTIELLIGTEPPHLYRSQGGPAERIEAFDQLDCREDWYTPWGGPPAVRTLAMTTDGHVYADIHVGSIMHSSDHGRSWKPVTPELNVDVHQVATTPADDDFVAANTANGPWVSFDRGESWQHRAGEPLRNRYGRAIAVDPNNASRMLVSVSDGPHGYNVHGQLYLTEDAGQTWTHISDPFPDQTPVNINTRRLAFSPDGRAWATAAATLYGSDQTGQFQEIHTFEEELEFLAVG